MNRKLTKLLLVTALLVSGGAAVALEEPEYEVLLSKGDIEFRHYEPYIVAEVTVAAKSADRTAFRILAGYIFGDNEGNTKMQMTAPVESRDAGSGSQDSQDFSFVMEKAYTIDTLPTPDDERIRLREKSPRFVAVRQFSGRWTDSNIKKHEQQLLDDLRSLSVDVIGPPELARYNSPFMPWFLRRNEIVVPVDWQSASDAIVIAAEAPARL